MQKNSASVRSFCLVFIVLFLTPRAMAQDASPEVQHITLTEAKSADELRESLNALVGFAPKTKLILDIPEPAIETISLSEVTQKAVANSPEVVEAEEGRMDPGDERGECGGGHAGDLRQRLEVVVGMPRARPVVDLVIPQQDPERLTPRLINFKLVGRF